MSMPFYLRPRSSRHAFGRLIFLTAAVFTAFAQTVIAQQPAAAQNAQRGTPTTVTGILTALQTDDFENRRSALIHTLREERTGRIFQVKFDKPVPDNVRPGARVTISGQASGSELYAYALDTDSVSGSPTTSASVPATAVIGEQRTVVLLVNFADNPVQPFTVEAARNLVFGDVSNLYRESSFGQTWFTGDVFGWFTIAMSNQVCDPSTLARLAQEAARASGVDLSRYSRYLYMSPEIACAWAGMATLGQTPSEAWIVRSSPTLRVVSHELGHNFGLMHAHAWYCAASYIADPCTWYEYGDFADPMGDEGAQFNAFNKERLGWLGTDASPAIGTVLSSGTYAMEPYETASGGAPKALKVLRSVDPTTGARSWYYVESRRAIGADAVLTKYFGSNLLNGLMIRIGTDGDGWSSNVLNMTPETSSYWDPALELGRSFTDPIAGITLTTTSYTTAGASLLVTFSEPPCTRGDPAVVFSPEQTPPLSAATTYASTVSVTSTDSAACAAVPFNLSANAPSGWTAAFGSPVLNLTPGATVATPLVVTSAATATSGMYPVQARAANAMDGSKVGSATATYAIASSSLAVVASASVKGQSVNLSATVRAGIAAVPGATVGFTITKPDQTVITGSVLSDVNGTANYVLKLTRKDPRGTYTVRVSAYLNGVTGSTTTSFTVK